MANGHHALSLVSEPPATLVPPTERAALVEERIGQAVADAACLLCAGMFELQAGELRRETKNAGGTKIAALYQMQQDHGAEVFSAVARERGRIALRAHLDMGFYRTYGPAAGEATINAILDEVLAILGHVTACEKASAN